MYQRFEKFSLCLTDISRHWHKLTGEEMERHGLKTAHGQYLLALARAPQGLTAPQLCQAAGKDKSDVSRMMRIMEEKGLVCKQGGHQNRYGGVFTLTQEGQQIAQHIRTRASRAVEIAGKDLTTEQRDIFYYALESITNNIRQMSKEGL